MKFINTDFLLTNEIYLKLEHTADADETKEWLPAYYFLICKVDGTVIGKCDLRIGHNMNTYYGGNIGYEIISEFRGNHYAEKACTLLLQLAKKHGMEYINITCSPENIASRKTCKYAGGTLEAILDIPVDNDMYINGERKKCIFRFIL